MATFYGRKKLVVKLSTEISVFRSSEHKQVSLQKICCPDLQCVLGNPKVLQKLTAGKMLFKMCNKFVF